MARFTSIGRSPLLTALLLAGAVCVADVAAQGTAAAMSGTLTDMRDGKTYQTMRVGAKTWMAENINIETGASWCYGGDSSNCNAYGRLYDWVTAKTVCPSGWRLPSVKELSLFVKAVNDYEIAAKKRKAKNVSDENEIDADESRLPAILGGGRYRIGGDFGNIGGVSYWWAATENANRYAYYRYVNYGHENADDDFDGKEYGLSVRCVMDGK